jgi:hypothetical protein
VSVSSHHQAEQRYYLLVDSKLWYSILNSTFVAPGLELKFKNSNQLKFFLTDYKGECKVYAIASSQHIPVDLKELFKHTAD